MLLNKLKESISQIFSPKEQEKKISKKEIISRILLHRMVGKSPIEGIATIMKYDEYKYSSVGSVSKSLSAIGAILPSVQVIPVDEIIEIKTVSDEIFIGSQPILITLEPISSTILSIELANDRKKDTWSEHIKKIESSGKIKIVGMVTDNGTGLRGAIEEREISWQPDTYHAIAHRLGKWVDILERRAYKRIDVEYDRKRVISSAKTKSIINKRRYKYNKARKKSEEAIYIYESFLYLYSYLIGQLQPFHSSGKLRNRDKATENIKVALELIESLKNEHINKQVESIEKILPELLNYFDESQKAIQRCEELGIDEETLTILTLVWQWDKAVTKSKKDRKKRAKAEYLFYLGYAKDILKESYERLKIEVFSQLNHILQASSMVENINSILRLYLDGSRNHITQEFLNLFAYYHNHRRYNAGKRKGKSPMEILTKKRENKDWIELLTHEVERVEPNFFV